MDHLSRFLCVEFKAPGSNDENCCAWNFITCECCEELFFGGKHQNMGTFLVQWSFASHSSCSAGSDFQTNTQPTIAQFSTFNKQLRMLRSQRLPHTIVFAPLEVGCSTLLPAAEAYLCFCQKASCDCDAAVERAQPETKSCNLCRVLFSGASP